METSLIVTTFLMGLAGGPHCIAMCGAACGGLQSSAAGVKILPFHLGRLIGYGLLGAVAAASVNKLAWFTEQTLALHPLWTFFHALVLAWGLMLLLFAKQPVWADQFSRHVWRKVKSLTSRSGGGIFTGMLWALMPCGLLYSALLVASLNANAVHGALSMATFAIGTSLSLIIGPFFWFKLKHGLHYLGDATSMRAAGLFLSAIAGWAIWMDVMHQTKVWCT